MSEEDEKINALIAQIASRHGIALSRDDPIMIMQTMNENLIKDSVLAQQGLLEQFKSEMEITKKEWTTEAKNHSAHILNATVLSGKTEIARIMEEKSSLIIEESSTKLNAGFNQILKTVQLSRQTALLNILASFITLFAAAIILYVAIN